MAEADRPRQRQRRSMINSSDQSAQGRRPGKTGTLSPELQAHIGRQLRSLYDEVLKEPVPEHLRELLAELEKKPSGTS
jgi:hypothetical protein